jgi:hypothetical protein
MTFSWKPIATEHFIAFQRLMGLKIVEVDGNYWCEVRPFFYRPLPVSRIVPHGSPSVPSGSKFCGAQYAVDSTAHANSYLNRLAFENKPGYSLDSLQRNWKRKVRLAAKELVIQPIPTAIEFTREAHSAYLSFYERTRYDVRTERRDPAYFAGWSDALYRIPNILILGGFRGGKLGGVSLSLLLNRTLFYSTFFCDDDSLGRHLPDLMLHTIRESASASPAIDEIYASMYKGGLGLDAFYLKRGAKIVQQPAHLKLNPLVRFVLQQMFPRQYAQILGQMSEQPRQETPPEDRDSAD